MPKRDAAYYKDRLRRDHAAIYKDLADGRIASVRKAAAVAGLIKLPSRLDVLKRNWNRASSAERRDFLIWLKGTSAGKRPASAPAMALTDSNGRLTSAVKGFLSTWLKDNRARPARIMKEIGLKPFDTTIAEALKYDRVPRPEVTRRLSAWLHSKGFRK
jgi:hypothetical protein